MAATGLLGEPVWTHQFALPGTWDRAREALCGQIHLFRTVTARGGTGENLCAELDALPDGPARVDACERWAAAECSRLGSSVFTIARGQGRDDAAVGRSMLADLSTAMRR